MYVSGAGVTGVTDSGARQTPHRWLLWGGGEGLGSVSVTTRMVFGLVRINRCIPVFECSSYHSSILRRGIMAGYYHRTHQRSTDHPRKTPNSKSDTPNRAKTQTVTSVAQPDSQVNNNSSSFQVQTQALNVSFRIPHTIPPSPRVRY